MKLTRLCATVVILVTCEFIASETVRAAALIWTNQSGNFSDSFNWNPASAPVFGDGTQFTNDTSYTVTFTTSAPVLNTNQFNGHAGTVTLDIGAANNWTLTNTVQTATNGAFVVGRNLNTTASVFMISGSLQVTSPVTTFARI